MCEDMFNKWQSPCSLNKRAILNLFSTQKALFPHIPGSAPSKRYGWLQHFRSCINTLSNLILPDLPAPLTISMSFIRIFVYLDQQSITTTYNKTIQNTHHSLCILQSPTYIFISFFGGSFFSTSDLRRRSRKGRRTLWSLFTSLESSSLD